MLKLLIPAFALAALAAPAMAADEAEHQPTAAGVQAVEAHWTRAFMGGDEAYLQALLDPAYVSVNHVGRARPKAEIIALAKKMASSPPMALPAPPAAKIDVHGDAAIVTSSAPGDVSVDVFYFRDGAWHAWYSQHTGTAAPPAPAKPKG